MLLSEHQLLALPAPFRMQLSTVLGPAANLALFGTSHSIRRNLLIHASCVTFKPRSSSLQQQQTAVSLLEVPADQPCFNRLQLQLEMGQHELLPDIHVLRDGRVPDLFLDGHIHTSTPSVRCFQCVISWAMSMVETCDEAARE